MTITLPNSQHLQQKLSRLPERGDGMKLHGQYAPGFNLECAKIIGIHIAYSHMPHSHFGTAKLPAFLCQMSNLAGADFTYAYLGNAEFSHCILSGACFYGANLQGAVFNHCDLSGVNFDKAILNWRDMNVLRHILITHMTPTQQTQIFSLTNAESMVKQLGYMSLKFRKDFVNIMGAWATDASPNDIRGLFGLPAVNHEMEVPF